MTNSKHIPKRRFKEFESDSDWEETKLRELFQYIGNAFVGTATPYYVESGHFYLESNNIKDGQINHNTEVFINDEFYQKQKNKWLQTGDMVMVQSGHVGHTAVIPENLNNSAAHALIMFRNPSENLESYFLNYQYQTTKAKEKIKTITTGNTIQHILASDMKEFKVYISNPEEQKKIGKFFQTIDSLITLHQHKLDKLKDLKKAYLAELFPAEGERVPKRRFPGFEGEWEKKKLGEIMDVGSVKRVHQSDWRVNGVRFLRARDIVSEFKNEVSNDYLYIDEELYKAYTTISGKVEKGDVLVTGVGTIGVPLLIKSDEPLYFKDGNIIWFKNKNKIDGYFFYYSFIGNTIQKFIGDVAGIGTVGTYTIDSGKNTPILLPKSKEEQILIGNFLKKLDNSITLQRQKLDKLKDLKKAYLNELFV